MKFTVHLIARVLEVEAESRAAAGEKAKAEWKHSGALRRAGKGYRIVVRKTPVQPRKGE